MIWQIYVFVGLLAVGTAALSINQRLAIDAQIASATASFILWTIWAFSSYNVEVITDGGVIVTNQYVALVMLGLAAAGIMFAWSAYNVMAMFGMAPDRLLEVRL